MACKIYTLGNYGELLITTRELQDAQMRLKDRHKNNTSSTSLRMALYCEDIITFYDDFYDQLAAAGRRRIFNGSLERGILWQSGMGRRVTLHIKKKKKRLNQRDNDTKAHFVRKEQNFWLL